ncbi:MAG: hypothetical protein N7Q72_03040, partial [Spiroplasma sp. Tabriz.8]|nr:hypothetical protein [Spiroplasma sp. Tabriz.8]
NYFMQLNFFFIMELYYTNFFYLLSINFFFYNETVIYIYIYIYILKGCISFIIWWNILLGEEKWMVEFDLFLN